MSFHPPRALVAPNSWLVAPHLYKERRDKPTREVIGQVLTSPWTVKVCILYVMNIVILALCSDTPKQRGAFEELGTYVLQRKVRLTKLNYKQYHFYKLT